MRTLERLESRSARVYDSDLDVHTLVSVGCLEREREREREREIFIRIKQAPKRDMLIKPGAYCLATYQWYSIQTKIKQKRKAKGEKCNTKATITQEYGKYVQHNEWISFKRMLSEAINICISSSQWCSPRYQSLGLEAPRGQKIKSWSWSWSWDPESWSWSWSWQ